MKLYLSILSLMLFSCTANEEKKTPAEVIVAPTFTKANLTFGCYQMIVDRDSAIARLDLKDTDSVVGKLYYNRFEKDDNAGAFFGRVDSNKIVGWYSFQSEGVITVRQVVFKIIGDKLAEGYGDVSATGDTAYFAYPHTLDYEESHPFEKIPCPDSSTIKL